MSRLLMSLAPVARYEASRMLGRCPRIDLREGETVGADDAPAAKLLVVEKGIVQLVRRRPNARRPAVLALAGPGAVLLPLACDEQLGALTAAVVTLVSAAACRMLLELPYMADVVVDVLLDALRERQETLAHTVGAAHSERLREALFQLARVHGKVGPDGVEIGLPLTHELLARIVGSARETVTTAIKGFERDGLLVRDGGVYRLNVAPSALEANQSS
jgi:CRP/FNR family transcriptional regulator